MINLLPPKRLTDMRLAYSNTVLRRYVELVLLSLIGVTVVLSGANYLLQEQRDNSRQTLEINQRQAAHLKKVQQDAEQLSATVNTIAGLQTKTSKFSEMLTKIGSLMPTGSVLTGLQTSIEDRNSPLVISAQTDTEETAAILRNNLAHSELFARAEIQTIVALDPDETAAQGTASAQEAVPAQSPYKYTATINAYFKENQGEKQP